ncbi:MAG: hypothetical protein C0412_19820 [Flavobacterium sp.]|nr:hypothetical protein [Flavobacterium sp.]
MNIKHVNPEIRIIYKEEIIELPEILNRKKQIAGVVRPNSSEPKLYDIPIKNRALFLGSKAIAQL